MAKMPKKAVVIGMDAASPTFISQYVEEGVLPNFKKLIDGGVMAEHCLVPFPTVTPPNWTTIVTGSWAGTHCITDFHVHNPGDPLHKIHQGFDANECKAEFIWERAAKAGKKSIVFNYPSSWPPRVKEGVIMLGGGGLTPGEWRRPFRGLNSGINFSGEHLFTTEILPGAVRVKFEEAEDWENVPESQGEEDLEAVAGLNFQQAMEEPAPTSWYVLAQDTQGDGYDKVTVSPSRDYSEAFFTIGVGEWSQKITTTLKLKNGEEKVVHFRAKLLELSDDAEDFRLYFTSLGQESGWSFPEEVCTEIKSKEGVMANNGGYVAYTLEWIDLDTYMEVTNWQNIFYADAVEYLLKNKEWDLFFMHAHAPDWFYHAAITDMEPLVTKDEEKVKKTRKADRSLYQSLDRMLGRIMEAAGKDALIIIVSDHGATANGPTVNPNEIMEKAGLLVFEEVEKAKGGDASDIMSAKIVPRFPNRPNHKKSKVIPQREIHVYINLKGRDPDGIVEPEDYGNVQRQIIDALLTWKDPQTGTRPIAMALSKQDARILGLYGDYVGDVIYALYPEFGGQHGQQLPASSYGIGDQRSVMILNGPGLKKGYKMQRTMWLTDIVPTLSYALDLPVADTVEGAVVYQIFEDPNFKLK
ncbi:MAG: alkaline phosphatase family protein [Deltaproteobacteria bacterium]|nr:alkaline phosphatase family protein [Deltaproteobacteria bacterium]